LVAHGHISKIATLGRPCIEDIRGVQITRYQSDNAVPKTLSRLGRSRAMQAALCRSDADVFHTHGLWMMPNVYPAQASRQLGRPLVLSPRGMLAEDALKFSAYAKKVFWHIWQSRAVDSVGCFHATASSEYEDIRALGLLQPVAIIPNGVDLPVINNLETSKREHSEPFVLSLGRIHPIKRIDRLISAFASVTSEHPEWKLRIIGPDSDGHGKALQQQIVQAGLSDRISIEAPLFGEDKIQVMKQAAVFALSTQNENFAMTVAESLAVGTPVISTKGAPWAGLTEQRCGWWVDHGPEPMAAALREVMEMPFEARCKLGARGRDWMARDFAWEGIGQKMTMVYAWLLGRGPRPDCVHL